jgi:hypothetical protein
MVRPGRINARGTDQVINDASTTDQPADAPAQTAGAPKGARLDQINKWIALGANVGVLLGLLLVFFEMRQNADLTRIGMEQRKNDLLAQIELSLSRPEMADIWVRAARTPETLTDAEIRMVESHLVSVMLQWDHMLQMDANGLISRANTQSHITSTAPFYFGSRFAKNWWRHEEPGWKGTSMWEIADPIIRNLDENFIAARIDRTRIAPAPAATPAPAAATP